MGGRAKRSFVMLGIAAAIAVLAAGCGGGGSSTSNSGTPTVAAESGFSPYEVQMQQLGQSLARTLLDLGSANKTATPTVVVKDLKQVQKELRAAAVKLTAIQPPAKIKAQHQKLIAGVRQYADEIDGVIAQYKKGNKQAVFAVAQLKGVKDMSAATLAIQKAGFVITLA
jgi:ABC-type phosphate/phosphonate transport system substrate-binding protein